MCTCRPDSSAQRPQPAYGSPRKQNRRHGCAVVCGPTRLSSRAERPATQPAGPRVPSPASLSVPGATTRPPASRAFAPRSAKRPPPRHSVRPGTDPDPGPRFRHWVGLGAERRSGGGQRLHSPNVWLPSGHEPGAGGGVATTAPQQNGGPFGPGDFWIDDAISGSRRGLVGSEAAEAGQRRGPRADEASRAQQSDRPQGLRSRKRAIRERHGKR
jgi:hypothetical protein